MKKWTRDHAVNQDQLDALAPMRELFELPPGQIYLCGNSLGPLPKGAAPRLKTLLEKEWAYDLVQGWNRHDWMSLPSSTGDKIARLVGAGPGEIMVTDSTSLNLYKALYAALRLQSSRKPGARIVVTEKENFPSDLYMAGQLCRDLGCELVKASQPENLNDLLNEQASVLMLTEVNYRSARRHDMRQLTRLAHQAGALVIWDLAHSAGALPVDLKGCDADFAVGCGYKYLCGGPGAPGYIWIHPRLADHCHQPLTGWLGHARPFAFEDHYEPAAGSSRFLCGTPPVLSMAALDAGLDLILTVENFGGMAGVWQKSLALSDMFMTLIDEGPSFRNLRVETPRDPLSRGSHVSLSLQGELDGSGYALMQALIARGVVGDFRSGDSGDPGRPDLLRFGITPLYLRYVDVFDAVEQLGQVIARGEWRESRYQKKAWVT